MAIIDSRRGQVGRNYDGSERRRYQNGHRGETGVKDGRRGARLIYSRQVTPGRLEVESGSVAAVADRKCGAPDAAESVQGYLPERS